MKPSRPLCTSLLAAPLLLAVPAYSQTDQTASLMEALSMVSGGMLVSPTAAPEVTSDGDRFRVHIPLPNLTSPPDQAIEILATLLVSGVWDITSLTFPATGTLVTQGAPDTPPVSLRYKIGQQAAHARVDDTLSSPSPYTMALSDIAVHVDRGRSPADLAIGQMTVEGTITGDTDRRITNRSRSRMENVRLIVPNQTGKPFTLALRSADFRYDVNGLDRAQAAHMRDVTKAFAARRRAAQVVPGEVPDVREQLRAIVEASDGLLSGFRIEDTFQGLHFETGGGSDGTAGEIRVAMEAEAAHNLVGGHFDAGLNDMTLISLPAQYVPRRVAIKSTFSGISVESLRRWLRAATASDADPSAVRAGAVALLNEPGARAAIETLFIEAGPLVIHGSARIRPLPDGTAGYDVHLTAHGLDAMLGLIQSDPQAQQVMPMLFLAKGMGKPDGDGLVWDIGFADGLLTVNGLPMGQKGGGSPAVRPPSNR